MTDRIVIMGVSGCGKSTVGAALAKRLGGMFQDGDDFHPGANIRKMSNGEPLTDADRWPWLDRVGQELGGPDHGCLVMACSALKTAYRDRLRQQAGREVVFVLLQGSQEFIAQRMQARSGHFMPPDLLQSQFDALEAFGPQETAVTVDIVESVDDIVEQICQGLKRL
ncbi:gluconokinase [Neptunicoccus cionae]|uniref:gluconokinase n=1 Tax=Neptunicoccus cionae TaxID=2035344 RepID=UPI0025712FD4|nr:gluconokinase [Amylibacter cionae]